MKDLKTILLDLSLEIQTVAHERLDKAEKALAEKDPLDAASNHIAARVSRDFAMAIHRVAEKL